jgi:hypothetical protein
MRMRLFLVALVFTPLLAAQQPADSTANPAAALTIYNENFAVARTTINLDLHPGLNEVSTNQVTTQLEPDSVILRDPAADASVKPSFRIVEQNYDAAVVTQDWLLQKFEGKTIQFEVPPSPAPGGAEPPERFIEGKIIRAPLPQVQNQYGDYEPPTQPLIEVNGQMEFELPGTPLFPASTDGLMLKPTLRWQIDSDREQKLAAEFAYITGGLNWEATYNVVTGNGESAGEADGSSAASEEKADVIGWVTITNHSGAEFPAARIKLMAGDVAKIQPEARDRFVLTAPVAMGAISGGIGQVTQKPFDDFHLYDLHRTVTLQNGETKQVQFLEANGVTLKRSYVYDGADLDRERRYNFGGQFIQQQNYGLDASNTKVQIMEEIKNSEDNHLGVPLPAGRIRLYRRDADGQMEFVGENVINHTPVEDTIKISTGSAFDIKGSRRQTDFYIDNGRRTLDEFFEIKVTNQKSDPVTVSVLEHLYRGDNWEILEKSTDYTKLDSHTIEFPVQVPAKGDATVTYKVRYTW